MIASMRRARSTWLCLTALTNCTGRGVVADVASGDGADTDTASTMDDDDAGTESASATGADTTGSGGARCGDGVLDPGESCDDNNAIDGDGCSHYCVPSGSELWAVDAELHDCNSLAIDVEGSMFVNGPPNQDFEHGAHVRRFDLDDGALLWQADYDPPEGTGNGWVVLGLRTRGGFTLAGDSEVDELSSYSPWSQTRTEDGGLLSEFTRIDPKVGGLPEGFALDGTDSLWFSVQLIVDGQLGGSQLWPVSVDGSLDAVIDVDSIVFESGSAASTGPVVFRTEMQLASYGLDGELQWSQDVADGLMSGVEDVAVAPNGDIFVAMGIDKGTGESKIVVRTYTADGAPIGEFVHAGPDDATAYSWGGDVEVDSSGNAVVVSMIRGKDSLDDDIRLGKYTSGGQMLWSQLFGAPDVQAGRVETCGIAIAPDDAVVIGVFTSFNGESPQTVTLHKFAP